MRIYAPDNTVSYGPKKNRINTAWCRKCSVFTTFTIRFRIVNDGVLIDLGILFIFLCELCIIIVICEISLILLDNQLSFNLIEYQSSLSFFTSDNLINLSHKTMVMMFKKRIVLTLHGAVNAPFLRHLRFVLGS
jgi:hypothetical protein